MTRLNKTLTKAIVFMIITVLCAPVVFMQSETVSAATKTPAKPAITYCKAKGTAVTLKWAKAKNAKTYRVYVQTGASKWKYWKKVKKSSKNRKKYSNTLKYKLVKSGKKYKVYRQQNPFKITAKKLKKRTYTFKGSYGKTYRFAVRAFNGKKYSKASVIKTAKTVKKPAPTKPEDPVEPVKAEYTITYHLNGGENSAENPGTYVEGSEVALADPVRENYSFQGWFTDAGFSHQIKSITKDTKGNLDLYAKWYLAALNINSTGMNNMIWSWWYYPQVVSESDKVFWGYATNEGYCGVAQYDRADGNITKTALKRADEIDDHNGLALTLLDDKRIMCAYAGGHNKNKEIHIRISDDPLDISSFSNNIVLESRGVTCYSQIIKSSGKYWLFYRVNNNSWAYRTSPDGKEWSEETIAVKATMQYYCRFVKTTEDSLIRIVMYSNPSGTAPEIRMGFLDTTGKAADIYNADGRTVLGNENISYDSFTTIIDRTAGKTQRLFDVAVTAPENPRILYTTFTGKKETDDSVYYLYDSGESKEICKGGKPLMDPKYQLGAAFIDSSSFVAARNKAGTDYIETYSYDNGTAAFEKEIDSQIGSASSRNARPIVDVNGKALLWHNGWYDKSKYTDFDTSARLYLMDHDKVVTGPSSGLDVKELSKPDAETVNAVKAYAQKLYDENMTDDRDYLSGGFTWDQEYARKLENNPNVKTKGWIYFNALMMDAFLTADSTNKKEILRFYDSHINEEGKLMLTRKTAFFVDTLDNVMPAAIMVRLVNEGFTNSQQSADYSRLQNDVYNKLEKQIMYDGKDGRPYAGKLWLHHQVKDSTTGEYVPAKAWSKWNICLDGVYMSQLYLIRLAEAIDMGTMVITANDGHVVTSEELWDDIYTRMMFVMDHMRISRTGLLAHVYSVDQKKTNDIAWGRGMGWFSMALLEAAEQMPDPVKKAELQKSYVSLMRSVLEWQDPDSLLWYNVMERKTELDKNRPETSGSAMLAYCLLRGYQDGILKDEAFHKGGLAAFNAMVKYHYTEADGLTDTLLGMGPGEAEKHYLKAGYTANDAKGIAPLILAACYAY